VDEDLADVSLVPAGQKLIQQLVAELVPFGRRPGEETAVRALLEPLGSREW
jgi:hypothetical protein